MTGILSLKCVRYVVCLRVYSQGSGKIFSLRTDTKSSLPSWARTYQTDGLFLSSVLLKGNYVHVNEHDYATFKQTGLELFQNDQF